MPDTAHDHALLLATALDEQPDQVDPEEAGTAGLAHLDVLLDEGGATEETVELGVRLLSFATERLPSGPLTPMWRYRAGGALSFLAEVLDSVPHLDSAIAFLTAAAHSAAEGELAEQAAVDCAELIRLRLLVSDELSPVDARRWTGEVAALGAFVHSEDELLEYRRERALAHRWAYPHTLAPVDLDHALAGLEAVLPFDHDNRADLLQTQAILLEERHRLTGDPAALTAAIAAAKELADHAGHGQLLLSGLLTTGFWSEAGVGIDEAIDAYAAVPGDVAFDAEHTVNHGVLLCARGAENERVADLLAGTALLASVADEPEGHVLPVLLVLAESFLVLTRLDGPAHLWAVLDWTSAAIAVAEEHTDATTIARSWRLEAVEVAAKEFGVRAVMARHDVRGFLADAERTVRSEDGVGPEVRALLVLRIVIIRTQWLMDVAPIGEHPDVTFRNLRELLADFEPHLPPEDMSRLKAMVDTLDAATRYAVSGTAPDAAVFQSMLAGLDDGGERDAAGDLELDVVRLLNEIIADPRQEAVRAQVSRITSLVWRVDALPDCEEKTGLGAMVSLLSRIIGPPGGVPSELVAETGDMTGLSELLAQTHAWQAASSEGDVQQALRAYEGIERAESGATSDSGLAMMARMLRGVYRAHLDADVPTNPEALDTAIAELEVAFAKNPSPDNALALGSRLRMRDRPGDRAASRVAGLAAAGDQVTAWCLDDSANDDLVQVLEARRRSLLGLEVHSGPTKDVLIYLVPGCDAHEGFAATIAPDEDVRVIALPELRTRAIRAWREAVEKARVTPSWRGWTTELARITAWVWKAAEDAFTPWAGKRLALVPMGDLGLVPWTAAWREIDGERRYLVQDNEITLLPAASTPQAPVREGAAVFVGNPDRTNGDAATIAEQLRTAFHPQGRFLGGHGQPPRPWRESPQGRGTPDEIRAAAQQGLAILHLGCRTTSDPAGSTIQLHGGELPVAELHGIGLVTLTDHVSKHHPHDDALTAPAQLVANGTRSVLAAQWPRPSGALLHLVHHHLARGLEPSAALRAAQLQLIDPGRVLPEGTPADLPHDPAAIEHWAVLAHHGR
ncbi:CHAT domain-containing protein [Lentzea sp. NPDC005914]|uniref:CHAT domain-containing protein n=1 Tax=Lentzea sp. NPDC005914 TaxID=3154572 RepID=UPI0033DA9AE3